MSHLDDSTLDGYLDSALPPARRAEVDSHLAACRECAARLDQMRALFIALDSLPESPLERDLAAGVLSIIRTSGLNPRPPRQLAPILRALVAAQGLLALALLAAAVPFAAQLLQRPELTQFTSEATRLFSDLSSSVLLEWNLVLAEAGRLLTLPASSPGLPLPPLSTLGLALVLLAAGLMWLVGNGVLLKEIANSRQLSAVSRK